MRKIKTARKLIAENITTIITVIGGIASAVGILMLVITSLSEHNPSLKKNPPATTVSAHADSALIDSIIRKDDSIARTDRTGPQIPLE